MKSKKKIKNRTGIIIVLMFIVIYCTGTVSTADKKTPPTQQQTYSGKVIETMDSGGYTYVQFEEKGKKHWVAARKFPVSVGDTIEFSQPNVMKNFHSRTLNKTFEWIFFVNVVKVGGKQITTYTHDAMTRDVLPQGHPAMGKKKKPQKKVAVKPGSVKKAAEGYTVAECYALKDSLRGKEVKVRGTAVKFTPNILKRNWLHLRDGSGAAGTNDLTVTTKETVNIGDLVLISGKISYDKNFGAGYRFAVIVEDAAVKIEKPAK
ncbi:MAG: DNA-binding protein [Candidatus Aminicenantes bacterium]|nr:DNA-binding protein [Candidatus Aminicenantes bacterium]